MKKNVEFFNSKPLAGLQQPLLIALPLDGCWRLMLRFRRVTSFRERQRESCSVKFITCAAIRSLMMERKCLGEAGRGGAVLVVDMQRENLK